MRRWTQSSRGQRYFAVVIAATVAVGGWITRSPDTEVGANPATPDIGLTCPAPLAPGASPVPTPTPIIVGYGGPEFVTGSGDFLNGYATDIFSGEVVSVEQGTPVAIPDPVSPRSKKVILPSHIYEVSVIKTLKGEAKGIVEVRQNAIGSDTVYHPVLRPGDLAVFQTIALPASCAYDLVYGAFGYNRVGTPSPANQT